MLEEVIQKSKSLKLGSFSTQLEETLKIGEQKNWSSLHILNHLLNLESERRKQIKMATRFRQSRLGEKPTIDQFDFDYHSTRKKNKTQVLNLLDRDFSKETGDIILIGNPGTGKSFLAKCFGYQATLKTNKILFTTAMDMINQLVAADADRSLVKKLASYQSPDLLIIDEIGYLPLGSEGSNLFFQVISGRHDKKSTMITTNLPFSDWGNVFDNTTVATAIIDRLIFNADVFLLGGESYRKRGKKK